MLIERVNTTLGQYQNIKDVGRFLFIPVTLHLLFDNENESILLADGEQNPVKVSPPQKEQKA